jgi:hypothetical protein
MMPTLPQIAHPTYEITIPSSKKKHTFRPMLTGERKVLLIAMESQNPLEISRAVRQICNSCVNNLNAESLTSFDLEWVFLQLIINSIRDTIDLEVRIPNRQDTCEECGKPKFVKADLTKAQIKGDIKDKKDLLIDVGSGVGVKLKYPSDKDIELLEELNQSKTEIEKLMNLISVSIESVFDQDKTFSFSEYDYRDRLAWLEALPPNVTDKIEAFLNSIPQLVLDVAIECPKCKFQATYQLQGLSDFFV